MRFKNIFLWNFNLFENEVRKWRNLQGCVANYFSHHCQILANLFFLHHWTWNHWWLTLVLHCPTVHIFTNYQSWFRRFVTNLLKLMINCYSLQHNNEWSIIWIFKCIFNQPIISISNFVTIQQKTLINEFTKIFKNFLCMRNFLLNNKKLLIINFHQNCSLTFQTCRYIYF